MSRNIALPPLESKDGQAQLVDSINESTKHVNTFTVSFLVTCIYIAISVASISHEELLLGRPVDLPLLNVKVPLVHFFLLAPVLVSFLHLHLLLQEYFLFCKLKLLRKASYDDGVAARYFPGLPVNSYVGKRYRPSIEIMLRVLRFGIYQIMPLLLLCWFQVRFLPYHGWHVTLGHQLLILLDILLISYYSRKLSLLRKVPLTRMKWMSLPARTLVRSLVLLAVAFFSLFYAVVPGTWLELERLLGRPLPYVDRFLERNLSLRERTLVSEHPAPELLAARHVTRDKQDAVYLELARGMDLRSRDLRFADFTGSKLFNADMRGADLRSAVLINADLRGAKLVPTGGSDGVFDLPPGDDKLARISEVARNLKAYKPVRLEGADLSGANLRGVKLILADLTGARLRNGHLDGAELTQAKLTGADLSNADLRRVELSRSNLEFARLISARLTGSNLSHAVLIGADLREARMEAVDLKHAHLDYANLAEAHLEFADFKNATSKGAVFSSAWLQEATSLSPINGVILRGAKLRGIDFCSGSNKEDPALTDLRGADFGSAPDWVEANNPRVKAAREREKTCLQRMKGREMTHRRLLYSEGPLDGPLADWPPVVAQGWVLSEPWDEAKFFAALASALWDDACNDVLLAQALVKRTLDGYAPTDPMLSQHLACEYRDHQQKLACSGLEKIQESQRKEIVEKANRAESHPDSTFACPQRMW